MAAGETWMSDSEGLERLARIDTKLGTVVERLDSHGRDLRDLKSAAHRAQLASQKGFGDVTKAIALTDQYLETHESEDERRFAEVREQINGAIPNGNSRAKQIAKGGGLVVGGGGGMLVLLELLKLLGSKAG